ncbi:MAG TPA: glycoside hydrolase family 3 N-terminal domain-containing protein, partial [Blastocatellia bacterium]|nr:glycoside hydrolase family 3 N-terminal domain-containing protein [Blastocatellia bacterium]
DGPSPLPASLSKNIATGLLREELGFKGLGISDDLALSAITSIRDLTEAAVGAIDAGNDMVTVSDPQEAIEAWEAMSRAAKEGQITRQKISKCFDNIARVKSKVSPPHPLSENAVSRLRERIFELNVALQQGH